MIYPVGGFVLGALLGAFRARRRGGTVLDLLQWGAGFGVIFGLIGLFVMVFLLRSAT